MLPLCCPVVIVVQTKAVEFVCFLERGKSVSDEDKPRAHRISADLRRILAHHDEPVDYEPLSELMGEYEVGLRVVGCELPFIVRDKLLYRCRRVESTAAVRTHDERQSVCFVRTQQAAYFVQTIESCLCIGVACDLAFWLKHRIKVRLAWIGRFEESLS